MLVVTVVVKNKLQTVFNMHNAPQSMQHFIEKFYKHLTNKYDYKHDTFSITSTSTWRFTSDVSKQTFSSFSHSFIHALHDIANGYKRD